MSEFKRKAPSGGFQASEEQFGALEAESGFSAGQATEPVRLPEPAVEKPVLPIERRSQPEAERVAEKPAEETPRKKRYYSPGEVMKKKGCIGCGGMALVLPALLALLVLTIVLL